MFLFDLIVDGDDSMVNLASFTQFQLLLYISRGWKYNERVYNVKCDDVVQSHSSNRIPKSGALVGVTFRFETNQPIQLGIVSGQRRFRVRMFLHNLSSDTAKPQHHSHKTVSKSYLLRFIRLVQCLMTLLPLHTVMVQIYMKIHIESTVFATHPWCLDVWASQTN